jgi:hypothetical protein
VNNVCSLGAWPHPALRIAVDLDDQERICRAGGPEHTRVDVWVTLAGEDRLGGNAERRSALATLIRSQGSEPARGSAVVLTSLVVRSTDIGVAPETSAASSSGPLQARAARETAAQPARRQAVVTTSPR